MLKHTNEINGSIFVTVHEVFVLYSIDWTAGHNSDKHQILITLKKHRLLTRLENTTQGCTRKGYF